MGILVYLFIGAGVCAAPVAAAGATTGDTGRAHMEVLYLLPLACIEWTRKTQVFVEDLTKYGWPKLQAYAWIRQVSVAAPMLGSMFNCLTCHQACNMPLEACACIHFLAATVDWGKGQSGGAQVVCTKTTQA